MLVCVAEVELRGREAEVGRALEVAAGLEGRKGAGGHELGEHLQGHTRGKEFAEEERVDVRRRDGELALYVRHAHKW